MPDAANDALPMDKLADTFRDMIGINQKTKIDYSNLGLQPTPSIIINDYSSSAAPSVGGIM